MPQEKSFDKIVSGLIARRPDLAAKIKNTGETADAVSARVGERIASQRANKGRTKAIVGENPAAPGGTADESIIELINRPTCFVVNGDFELPPSPEIAQRLEGSRNLLKPRLSSVGIVEVFDGFVKFPVGTAWIVAAGVAVTNRHVAAKFAFLNDDGRPAFLSNLKNRPLKVTIDFAEEHGSAVEQEVAVVEILYMASPESGVADLALLKLEASQNLPRPIPLLGTEPPVGDWIAVVGYPQQDDRTPPEGRAVEEAYFGDIYGVKRLSPGQVDKSAQDIPSWVLQHDATTLGGNSGSVLIHLKTGAAAGVHFRGEYRKANYAVRATELAKLLSANNIASTSVLPPTGGAVDTGATGGEEAAPPQGFEGYAPSFIEPGVASFLIPLPKITNAAPGTIAKLKDGSDLLKYRNFTVQMREDRRLPYYSAVNVDGAATFSIKGPRPPWSFDDRMDRKFQIKDECYGNESDGKFSRGHMTRREDPNWGKTREEAVISNQHTFFVTNACPQIQPFNAGIWLSLEDHALEHCDEDDMRISVFTGPIFRDAPPNPDPDYFGVKVPVEFWKIIAFKHDETKQLTATGYRMSQRNLLPTLEEFVFGQFSESQVTIRFIERATGLSFGRLRDLDPMDDGTESVGTVSRPIRTPRDLVFKRAM
jgi:endonuclease G, mitochondrial